MNNIFDYTMKIQSYFLLICSALLFFTSCNKDEGIGGSSSLEGYVYQVRHWNQNTDVIIDTIPAVDIRIKLTFGDDLDRFYGKDLRTDGNGLYRFDFLREGRYGVTAYSELIDGQLLAKSTIAPVKGSLSKADTIFISTIVRRGFASIKGKVITEFFRDGRKIDEGLTEARVYIAQSGSETHFDDVRTSLQGIFVFSDILPGKYDVWVWSEDVYIRDKYTPVIFEIEVGDEERVYEFEQDFYIKRAR